MLSRLDSRLAFLKAGPRDLPARQQTLRSAIGWSYNLLTADERKLFRQLAVFAEGFTAEAASWVSDDPSPITHHPTTPSPSLDRLAALLDWSLLTRTEQPDGSVRFGMLETIHEFARERLDAAGDMEVLRQRHLQ